MAFPSSSATPGPLAFLGPELSRIRAAGRHRTMRSFATPQEPTARVDGRDVLLFCSNNYLGLATHPDVVAAAQEACARWGTGAGGSRLISGTTDLHRELEAELARLKGAEDAVLFGTGYQANLGAITALAGPEDLVASDRLNHASVIDACRLSRAEVAVYAHAQADDAKRALAAKARRKLLVTDGVFSMDGDEAPLRALADVAGEAGAILMVDDAHGTGVLGDGSGTAAGQGVSHRVDVHMGTLSKALGSAGGFLAGTSELCDYLRNVARPFIFSTAPAPPAMAAALAALRVLRKEPQRVERLLANASLLRYGLQGAGFQVPGDRTPIIPVVVGSEETALALMRALEGHGIYVAAVRPPTVAPGSCRLRATVMATHTEAQVVACVEAFEEAAATVPGVTASPASS